MDTVSRVNLCELIELMGERTLQRDQAGHDILLDQERRRNARSKHGGNCDEAGKGKCDQPADSVTRSTATSDARTESHRSTA